MTEILRLLVGRVASSIVLSLMLPLAVWASDATLTIATIDGAKHSGRLLDWSSAEIKLQTDEHAVVVPSSRLLRARWKHREAERTEQTAIVKLVDGTRLTQDSFEVEQGVASFVTPLATGPITLPTEQIEFVQLMDNAPELDQLELELDGDILVVYKKKTDSFDNLSGILGDISAEQVDFTWEDELIPVKRSKVAALAYFRARAPIAKDPVFWLNLNDGSELPVEQIGVSAQSLQVRTIAGLQLTVPLKWVREADFSQGKLAYLSDLKPISQHWTPRIDLPASAQLIQQHGLPRRDQSFTGSALTLFWPVARPGSLEGELHTYEKGVAMRSRTEAVYRRPKGMRRFAALVGIDPETAGQGNVTLEIFADRRSIWQGEIDGGAVPADVNVELGDARVLRLVVDYGANLDYGDRLHLAEARFSQ